MRSGRPATLEFRFREEMDFSSRHLLFRAADRAQHARVREAAAQDARHSFLDFFFRGLGMFVEKSFGRKNNSVQAIAALRGLLFDERFLNGVRLVNRAQSLELDNFDALHRFHRCDAGANSLALHNNRAGSALSEAAAEFRSAQAKIVNQQVKQRRCRIDIEAVSLPVYVQRNEAHIGMKLLRTAIFVKRKCLPGTRRGELRGSAAGSHLILPPQTRNGAVPPGPAPFLASQFRYNVWSLKL